MVDGLARREEGKVGWVEEGTRRDHAAVIMGVVMVVACSH